MLGYGIHGQIVGVHVLFFISGCGRNLRFSRPSIGFPVSGHAKRYACCRPDSHGGRTSNGAEIRIVHGVHVYIGSIFGRIEIYILNFGRSIPFNGIDIHRTREANPHAGGSCHAAGRKLGNESMGSRAVHYDAGLVFVISTAATDKIVSGCGNIQFCRTENLVVLGPGNLDGTRVCSYNGTTLHQCVSIAGDFVGGGSRSQRRPGVGANVKATGEVIEAVVALGHHAHAAVRCEILVFDDSIHIIADVVVASGSCGGHKLAYGYSSPYPYGMDIPVAGGPNLGKACVGRGRTFIRSHLRHRILIHAVDGDSHSPRYHTFYRNLTHRSHGVDLALGIRFNRNRRMIGSAIRVDVRIVERRPAVLVNIRYGSRALKIKVILAPSHGKAGAYGGDAGLLKFALVVFFLNRPAVNSRNRNRAISGRSDIGMVDLRPQLLFVAV